MDDLQSDRKEDDDDDDDDNDEIIIIENPNPKPKPPLIVLCESDDDEEPEINRESKDIISLDDSLISPDIIDIVSEPEDVDQNDNSNVDNTICSNKSSCSSYIPSSTSCINPMPDYIPLELPDSCDSDSSSNNHAITALDKNKRLLKKWYEKFKTKNSRLSSHKSSYTCPECRAELSTVKMLDRHVQSRHPSSIHRYQHNNTNAELGSECHSNGNASQQRLKLNPLKSPIYTGSATCSSISNTSTCTLTKNDQEPSKIAALPSLVNRRTVVHQNDKVSTATNTTSGRSSTTDGINTICQPLTVVIYSPNSERGGNDRFVQISPLSSDRQNMKGDEARLVNGNGNKQSDVIELFDSPCRDLAAVIAIDEMTRRSESISTSPCSVGPPPFKRQRQDPLILLSDDDNNEQKATRKAAKNNKKDNKGKGIPIKKTFSCYMHGKTFATLKALLQHNKDKHKHETSTSKLVKGKKRYSLRPRNDLNVRPFPSSSPPSMDKLKTMKHIVMIDIDNWQKIFDSDLTFSPSTFVWGFHGGSTSWRPHVSSSLLNNLRRMNCFYLHPKCGRSKDAADFALCVQAGKLDVLLPKEIIFTVLSGDRGFNELQNQLSLSKREVHIVNPHHKTIDTVLTILNSIADR